jgi:hypothetical protein
MKGHTAAVSLVGVSWALALCVQVIHSQDKVAPSPAQVQLVITDQALAIGGPVLRSENIQARRGHRIPRGPINPGPGLQRRTPYGRAHRHVPQGNKRSLRVCHDRYVDDRKPVSQMAASQAVAYSPFAESVASKVLQNGGTAPTVERAVADSPTGATAVSAAYLGNECNADCRKQQRPQVLGWVCTDTNSVTLAGVMNVPAAGSPPSSVSKFLTYGTRDPGPGKLVGEYKRKRLGHDDRFAAQFRTDFAEAEYRA